MSKIHQAQNFDDTRQIYNPPNINSATSLSASSISASKLHEAVFCDSLSAEESKRVLSEQDKYYESNDQIDLKILHHIKDNAC